MCVERVVHQMFCIRLKKTIKRIHPSERIGQARCANVSADVGATRRSPAAAALLPQSLSLSKLTLAQTSLLLPLAVAVRVCQACGQLIEPPERLRTRAEPSGANLQRDQRRSRLALTSTATSTVALALTLALVSAKPMQGRAANAVMSGPERRICINTKRFFVFLH